MLAAERRKLILQATRAGSVKVSELADRFGVSEMTVRRDLEVLDSEGALRKVRGGAVRRHSRGEELLSTTKAPQNRMAKQAIAARALGLIEDGSTIAVGAGTTTVELAAHLVGRTGITVITNSVAVFAELSDPAVTGPTVYLTGGVRTPSDALVGAVADATLESFRVDATILGVDAIDASGPLLSPNLAEAQTNRIMMRIADRTVVLADSSKFDETGTCVFGDLRDVTTLITDSQIDDVRRELVEARVGRLIIAEVD